MGLNDKLFDYLKQHLPEFSKAKVKGLYSFTCPSIGNHKWKAKSPTATVINGSDKISCVQCGFKGTFHDVVRLLEHDKKSLSNEQIVEYLVDTIKLDIYQELKEYIKYNWFLFPIAKNSKIPIKDQHWQEDSYNDKTKWVKWLENGLNIAVNCKKSKVMIVDVDNKNLDTLSEEQQLLRDEIIQLLHDSKTLTQNTPSGGFHFVFHLDDDISQKVDIAGLKIDTRTAKGYFLIAPSKINNVGYHWQNIGKDIKNVSADVKAKLLSNTKVEKGEKCQEKLSPEKEGKVKLAGEGGRNNTLVSLGGILVNKFNADQVEYILNLINQNFMIPPLPSFELQAMCGSLSGYKETEEVTQEKSIYEYLKQMQNDVTANDVIQSCFDGERKKRGIVDKYLSKFVKEGKAIRLSRGRYKYREKVEWSDKSVEIGDTYKYCIPYFDEVSYFQPGDIILLGGKTSHGKTTMALNFIKQMVDQKTKPFYIYSESGSRHQKIAKVLGLEDGSYYRAFHSNPLSIEIEPNSFTILDWLLISEKENSDTIFKFFAEEMERKGGILIILMQLKDSYDWFAPNMVKQFPRLAARYIFDSDDGLTGHFQIDKITDPIGNYREYKIPCQYNPETKLLTKQNLT